ncbi:MAG: DUF1425 domain-containing protein [Phycisphaerales bacterium JB060]
MNNRLTSRAVLAACLIAVTLTAGCSAWRPKVNTTMKANPDGTPETIEDARLIWDEDLARAVQLIGLIEGTAPNGFKRVEAELFNATRQRMAIRYRFEWFDAEGFAVDTPMDGFRDRALLSGERTRISAMAPNERAVDFELEIIGAP